MRDRGSLIHGALSLAWAGLVLTCTPEPGVGQERGPCSEDGACDQGLTCLSSTCVAIPGEGEGEGEGEGDGEGEGEGEPPCRTVVGDVVIGNSLDLEALRDVCEVIGDLTCREAGLASIDLHRLASVTGELRISGADVADVNFAALQRVGAIFVAGGPSSALALPALNQVSGDLSVVESGLTSLHLPNLTSVGGSVRLEDDPLLADFDPASLETVGADLLIRGTAIGDLSLPSLISVGADLIIRENQAVSTLALPALSLSKRIYIEGQPILQQLQLPTLSTVNSISIYASPFDALASVSMPALVTIAANRDFDRGGLRIDGTPSTDVEMAQLSSVEYGDITLRGCRAVLLPALTDVDGDILLDSLTMIELSSPSLSYVAGSVIVSSGEEAFAALTLPSLEVVGGDFRIRQSSIESVSLPALAAVSGLFLYGDAALIEVSLPVLASVQGSANPDAPYRGSVVLSGLGVTILDLPALVTIAGDLDVSSNHALESLSLPLLASVGGSRDVRQNLALTTCTGALITGVGDCAP